MFRSITGTALVTEKCAAQPVTPNSHSRPLSMPNSSAMQMEVSSLEVSLLRDENASATDSVASFASADAVISSDYDN